MEQPKINKDEKKKKSKDTQLEINFEEAELLLKQQQEKEKNEKLEIAKRYGVVDWESIHREGQEWYVGNMSLKTWLELNSGNDNSDMYDPEKYWAAKKAQGIKRKNEESYKKALNRNNLK
jgi:hypothetical protein